MTAAVWDPGRCGGDAFGLCVAADVVSAGRRSVACGITGTVWDPGPSGNEYLDLCVAAGRVWVARRPVTPGDARRSGGQRCLRRNTGRSGHCTGDRAPRRASCPGGAVGLTAAMWDPGRCGGDAFGLCVAGGVVSVGCRLAAPGVWVVRAAFVVGPALGELAA